MTQGRPESKVDLRTEKAIAPETPLQRELCLLLAAAALLLPLVFGSIWLTPSPPLALCQELASPSGEERSQVVEGGGALRQALSSSDREARCYAQSPMGRSLAFVLLETRQPGAEGPGEWQRWYLNLERGGRGTRIRSAQRDRPLPPLELAPALVKETP